MTMQRPIQTPYDIVNVVVSNNHKWIVALSKSTMRDYAVTMYDLEQRAYLNSFQITGSYVNSKEIKQNRAGNTFNVVYNDNSRFKMMIFDKAKVLQDLNVNNIIGLKIEANDFTDKAPMINSLFLDNDDIFVNVFWPINMLNYHFVYSWKRNTVLSTVVTT